jgi:peptidoglycan/LPS O-acetylase OafA/YrhL
MSTHILSILRFTAAIIVILSHQNHRFQYLNDLPEIFLAGPQMVTFFFVLSGFVLVIAYGRCKKIQVKKFLVKRIIKIYPLYIISLLPLVFFLKRDGKFDCLNLIINTVIIQSWIPPYPLTINNPAWYLSDLMFFSVTFPIIINCIKKYHVKSSIVFYMALLLWFLTQTILTMLLSSNFYQGYPSVSHDLIYYFPLSHYCSFLLGISGTLMLNKNLNKNRPYGEGYKTFFAILLLIIIMIQHENDINNALNVSLSCGASFYAPFFLLLIVSVFIMDNNWEAELVVKIHALAAVGKIQINEKSTSKSINYSSLF